MIKEAGALPIQELEVLQEAGFLKGFLRRSKKGFGSFQPASADLSITGEIYRVRGSILPRCGETVWELLKSIKSWKHDIRCPLDPGTTYLCKVSETVKLPPNLYGYVNPKSSCGRVDLHVRLLADGVPRFDSLPRKTNSDLWFLVSSRNFPLLLSEKDKLSQLRVFDGDTRFDETEMSLVYAQHQLLYRKTGSALSYSDLKIKDHDGSVIMTIDLEGWEGIVGYRAKPRGQSPVLVFNKRGHIKDDFFEVIESSKSKSLTLQNGGFYILATREYARVPINLAAEMKAMDERSGEFRSHYAGFIDPGWGYGKDGSGKGLPLVLEVRPFDDNLIVRNGQPICKLQYEHIRNVPDFVYGETGSNYHARQKGVLLSKHFFKE